MGHIFISYSSQDRDFILQLVQDLKLKKFSLWRDQDNITGQDPTFWNEIQAGIDQCTHFLFVISPHSLDAYSRALNELYYVTGLKPTPRLILVVAPPQRIDYARLPIIIPANRYQIYDFTLDSYEVVFKRVCMALEPSRIEPAPARDALPVQIFTASDFPSFADLITRSGGAAPFARAATCLELGLDPAGLDFIHFGADRAFAIQLVAFLYGTGNFPAMLQLCDRLHRVLHGTLVSEVDSIRRKLENSFNGDTL